MTFEVFDFIKDNKDLIDANEWDQVYDNALFNLDSDSIGEFSKAVLDAEIDPLKELDYVPDYFLSSTNIKSFIIPDHIHLLAEGCFCHCDELESIEIPESVETIAQFAFAFCDNLKQIKIPQTVKEIMLTAFDGTHDEAVIICVPGSEAATFALNQGFKVRYYYP